MIRIIIIVTNSRIDCSENSTEFPSKTDNVCKRILRCLRITFWLAINVSIYKQAVWYACTCMYELCIIIYVIIIIKSTYVYF